MEFSKEESCCKDKDYQIKEIESKNQMERSLEINSPFQQENESESDIICTSKCLNSVGKIKI